MVDAVHVDARVDEFGLRVHIYIYIERERERERWRSEVQGIHNIYTERER